MLWWMRSSRKGQSKPVMLSGALSWVWVPVWVAHTSGDPLFHLGAPLCSAPERGQVPGGAELRAQPLVAAEPWVQQRSSTAWKFTVAHNLSVQGGHNLGDTLLKLGVPLKSFPESEGGQAAPWLEQRGCEPATRVLLQVLPFSGTWLRGGLQAKRFVAWLEPFARVAAH